MAHSFASKKGFDAKFTNYCDGMVTAHFYPSKTAIDSTYDFTFCPSDNDYDVWGGVEEDFLGQGLNCADFISLVERL